MGTPNGCIKEKGGFIQYKGRCPSGNPNLGFNSFIRQVLGCPSLFCPLLGLDILGKRTLASLPQVLVSLILLPLMINKINSGRPSGRGSSEFSLDILLGYLAPQGGLHYVKETSSWLLLYAHVVYNGGGL